MFAYDFTLKLFVIRPTVTILISPALFIKVAGFTTPSQWRHNDN